MSATMTMTVSSYLDELLARKQIEPFAASVLEASGARTPEAILSLLRTFPSLASQGLVDASAVSNLVMKTAASPSMNALLAAGTAPLGAIRRAVAAAGYGAEAPAVARWKPSQIVPRPPAPPVASSASAAVLGGAHSIDTRGCLPWPVRDQGNRGTCVAFGTTALREQLLCESGAGLQDASEQFLYCDIKTNSRDPHPNSDGTRIEYAFESLRNAGICPEGTWPYNPVFNLSSISQGPPPANAAAQALLWACGHALYASPATGSGNAQLVLNALVSNNRPVAISLPVFSDPMLPQADNWTTPAGWLWGDVLDPPPTAVVVGGHCVCVTGFSPDSAEPLGGYFVIRNSWSAQWGAQLPQAGHHAPEPGYGQVSATYVERYLWEYGQL